MEIICYEAGVSAGSFYRHIELLGAEAPGHSQIAKLVECVPFVANGELCCGRYCIACKV
jgi:hypothetical protein